ncbi:MAG: cupredoxin domain-containing protein [Nitrolancea sp.]
MLKRIAIIACIGAILIILLAACGGSSSGNSGDTGSSGDAITIKETEMKFTPNNITVQTGQTVNIKLVNDGVVMHDFTIDDLNGQQLTKPLDPGKSTTFSLTAPDTAGTINFYCSQPGHKAAGMTGTITVQ